MKKKHLLQWGAEFHKKIEKFSFLFWLLPHLITGALFFFFAQTALDTDLFSLLPPSRVSSQIAAAERAVSEKQNSGVFILVAHADFDRARSAALYLSGELESDPGVARVTAEISDDIYRDMQEFFFTYRYFFMTDNTVRAVRENPRVFADNAKARAFMPFTVSSLENLDRDPFLLVESRAQEFIEQTLRKGTSLSPRSGVLWTEHEGLHYVLVTAELENAGNLSHSSVPVIYALQNSLADADPGLRFYNSGVQFHSYESASRTQREITIIATVSLLFIALLLLLVFRSIRVFLLALFSIAAASATAFCITSLFFGRIHLLTISFGTSLIGVSIDYILHYNAAAHFHNRKKRGVSPAVLAQIALGLSTTVISYSILVFSQFPILKQMAVFSVSGLISVFLSVVFLFPCFAITKRSPHYHLFSLSAKLLNGYSRVAALTRKKKAVIVAVCIAAAVPAWFMLDVDNNLRNFYSMPAHLLESEKVSAEIINHGANGSYYIIEGSSAQDVLMREESLCTKLDGAVKDGVIGSYLGTSQYLPSIEKQHESWKTFGEYLLPLASEQYEAFGFETAQAGDLSIDWNDAEGHYLDSETFFSYGISSIADNFWIGRIGEHWYSVVMPLHVADSPSLMSLSAGMPGVNLINKTEEIRSSLNGISLSRLALLFAAYCLIVLLLSAVFSFRRAIVISRGPLLSIVFTVSFLSYIGVPLNFFSVTAMVLILGMGIDYSIFLENSKGDKSVPFFAVMLCMMTTVLSFGTLSFSSFAPVGTFGLTLLIGILFSFIIAPVSTISSAMTERKDS